MIAPKTEGKTKELVPAGNHVARLYEIIYLGTLNTGYKDQNGDDKYQYKVRLTWELPNELRKFGKEGEEKELPVVISKEVTFSLYKSEKQTATLRTIANALVGVSLTDAEADSFDIKKLLGFACMLEISHETFKDNGNVYAKAVGFGSIPKGLTVPPQVNESKEKSVANLSREEIEELPEFIQVKMKSSNEYKERFDPETIARREEIQEKVDSLKTQAKEEEITPEDIPF